jgi:hypothetical protein
MRQYNSAQLPNETENSEPVWERRIYAVLAGICVVGFWLATQAFFVPVTYGIDKNGYLIGGKMLAEGHLGGIKPPDPFVYLGTHWVMVSPGRYGLKFPLGLPAIYAVIRIIVGASHWIAAAHELSPLLVAAAIAGAFVLFRGVVGSFHALLGTILLATGPATLFFANLPNSHAPALCVAVWGIVCLLWWGKYGGPWRAILAGGLLGLNFTVRYTEGLLLLPLLMVMVLTWRNGRPWREVIALPIAWAAPVLALLVFNLIALHHASGYALTRESTAFGVGYFIHNWRTAFLQFYETSLFFILPLTVAGAIMAFAWNWRTALVMWAWAAPAILIYMAYYWAPDREDKLQYMRFFLSILPALLLAAVWFLRESTGRMPARFACLGATAAGVVVAIASCVNLRAALTDAAAEQWENLACMVMQQHVLAHLPAGSVVFAEDRNIVPLQVAGDFRLYQYDLFTRDFIQSQAQIDPAAPNMLQPRRAEELYALLGNLSEDDLRAREQQLVKDALRQGRNVYVVLSQGQAAEFWRRLEPGTALRADVIDTWEIDDQWRGLPPGKLVRMEILQIR